MGREAPQAATAPLVGGGKVEAVWDSGRLSLTIPWGSGRLAYPQGGLGAGALPV